MRIKLLLGGCAALLVLRGAGAATVSPAELAQCAGISAAGARLDCYDALAHRVGDGAATVATPSPSRAAAPVSHAAAPATAATAPAPAQAPNANDPQNFGLSLHQMQKAGSKAPAGPKSVAALITGMSTGATGHARIMLDNNQTWDVLDDDGLLGVGNAITIRKASLGSFLMYAPSHHTYRVHRVN